MNISRRRRFVNPLAGLWGGPIGVLVGATMLFFGWQWRGQTQEYIAASARATGTVIEVVSQTRTQDGVQKTYFYPIVEFKTPAGEVVRFQDSTGSNPPAYREGETVEVLYDLLTPQAATVASWTNLWLPSTIVLAAGGLFVLFGVLGFLQSLFFILGLGGLLGALGVLLLRKGKQNRSGG